MPDSGSICFADPLDASTFLRFAAQRVPTAMKKIFHRLAPAFAVLIFSCFVSADDFKSQTILPTGTFGPLRVHNDQFMVIRNFTQDTGSARGTVLVTKPPTTGPTVNVLSATILDFFFLEPINNVVIAGPADVTVTCPDPAATCFVSYKKDGN